MQSAVPTVDLYKQNVKRVDRLISVQIVDGINVAVGMLLMIKLCVIDNIIISTNSIGSLTICHSSAVLGSISDNVSQIL